MQTLHEIPQPYAVESLRDFQGVRAVVDPYNKRVKLYGVSAIQARANEAIYALICRFSTLSGATKLTVYARDNDDNAWAQLGLSHEATIEGYFRDGGNAYLYAAYSDPERGIDQRKHQHDGLMIRCNPSVEGEPELAAGYTTRVAEEADAERLHEALGHVFSDYPSDFSVDSLREMIRTRANHFRLALDSQGEIAALASIEIDHDQLSAELTDCATLPAHRGKGLMTALMAELERDAQESYGIVHLYTIARATEVGMNRAFAKRDYHFTGRLTNNCRMPLGWESMNVWCKTLAG